VSENSTKKSPRQWRLWLSPLQQKQNREQRRRVRLELEELETRALLSASTPTPATNNSAGTVQPLLAVTPQTSPSSISGYTPQQIQQAYGFDQLASVNGQTINGAGETIAIVDAYYDPNITNDANTFNSQFNLPLFNSAGGPTLTLVGIGANGPVAASSLPQDSSGAWPLETSLDVEWAHAMAPQANILLVEASNQNLSGTGSLIDAVQYAASQTGVVAVSMSWGQNEFSGETSYDSYFQPYSSSNPNGYKNPSGVTFVAAAGDSGAYSGPIYPATSPNVLAVGGTTLGGSTSPTGGGTTGGFGGTSGFGSTFGSYVYGYSAFARTGGGLYSGTGSLSVKPDSTPGGGSSSYPGETAWSDGGGGAAAYEGEPSYQTNQASIDQTYGNPNVETYNQTTGTYSYYNSRMTPDVAYNADPNTGYAIYDSIAAPAYGTSGGWTEVGGTSAGSPQWAAIVALADQQRGASGGQSLDTNEVQNTLYNTLSNSTTYANVFHDITTGSNGYSAGTGYDLATGLGTPIVNNLVPLLANTTIPLGQLPTITGSGYGGSGGGSSASGFSSFSGYSSGSFYGYAAPTHMGAGLYTGAGSVSILQGSEGTGAPAGAPVSAPTNTPVTPLVSVPTPSAAPDALVAFSVTASPTPLAASSNGTLAAGASSVALVQNSGVFGASGWTGAGSALSLSSLGLPGSQIEDLAGDLATVPNDVSSDSTTADTSGILTDAPGVDASGVDASGTGTTEGGAFGMMPEESSAPDLSSPLLADASGADASGADASGGDATFVEGAMMEAVAADGGGGE
jgi:hypothetical protein